MIDYEGWRKWRDFTKTENGAGNEGKGGKPSRQQRLLTGSKDANLEPKRMEERRSLISPVG